MNTPSKVLVIGPSWVGDMVMAQSLFKTLQQQQPSLIIDVLAPAWSRPLLERMPEVNEAIDMPLGHGQLQLGVRRALGKSLRNQHYDQAIVLPNSLKSALVPFWAGIPQRTGYVGEMRYGLLNDARSLDKQRLPMTVQRFVALGMNAHDISTPEILPPRLQISEEDTITAMQRLGVYRERPLLIMCPGAEYGPAKRWPEEYYAEVARSRYQQGWSVWLMGSNKDQEVTASINKQSGNVCVDLAGRTKLAEAIDLMALADQVLTNDSGLMHVAAAVDRPLVAVYGSSDPGFTPPLNKQSHIVRLGLECSPCFKRECPLGHLKCLRDIRPEQVEQALEALPQ